MENNNDGQPTQGVDVLSKYKKMFEKLQTNPNNNKRPSREEILAKYFVPRANKEIFRVLPPLKGRDFLEIAFFHVIPVVGASGNIKYRKIYCPAHNDGKIPKTDANGQIIRDQKGNPVMVSKPCPLCAKSKTILSKQDPSIKGIKKDDMNPQQLAILEGNSKIWSASNQIEAKKFYIVRGIDKGSEKDGVKFWRFKHNYKQQGDLDKLGPAITNWMELNEIDFTDENMGTDLILTVVDADKPGGNGRTFRYVSSIYPKGSSILHTDPIVMKEWLNDSITWREVFKAATAPNVEPFEYLELVALGQTPYWDDSDSNNKKWVFPGRSDLEEKANTRKADFDAEKKDESIEMASDIVTQSYDNVTISNVTKEDVGEFKDDAVDLTAEIKESVVESVVKPAVATETATTDEKSKDEINLEDVEDYDDLPF